MEQIEGVRTLQTANWIDKRCRDMVHSVFSKLSYGELEVVEGAEHNTFPAASGSSTLKGKIHIHDISVYRDFVKGGSIGVSEAYIAGKWSSPNLTNVIRIFAKAQQETDSLESKKSWLNKLKNSITHWQNRNTQSGSKKNILAHYDLGNELYTRFLDPEMMYSSAIYPTKDASLDEAQLHKLATICQRLSLSDNDHLLEIGTGWGGLAIYAAQNYGCKVTTTTISDAQFNYAQERINKLGLQDQITLLKQDYRDLTGSFDKVVSIEMIEAVGYEFLPSFFKQCNDLLKDGGKLLIQSITIADQRFDYYRSNVDFIQRYIFPGGFLPSVNVLSDNITRHSNLVVEQLDDIGLDYAQTLAHWREKFLVSWSDLTQFGYDDTFKRLWLYYFAYCEGAFLERSTSAVHIVARK
ncbi:SAM-dependent methyltransferase [Colwellia hornerae]|uniref:Class I SAM-dependent methyltransferase n=1 Tax=Colwellia hornerae TaxID=89402 RepID=A0A5C6QM12_9GAMM|nr:cyclopropane-fatty-acyl-phospholipid synthase family protein [Colwellia hornerae]TWX53628.1 class I SAM-dependent methyltransferase [Colwellia hornerae]TWX60279.1 class I SAM-dependent methyltransferase [Colwellia hornerae]TWX70034.1 class I SAM-dependent methyltransferase [Colwellia hornerae]